MSRFYFGRRSSRMRGGSPPPPLISPTASYRPGEIMVGTHEMYGRHSAGPSIHSRPERARGILPWFFMRRKRAHATYPASGPLTAVICRLRFPAADHRQQQNREDSGLVAFRQERSGPMCLDILTPILSKSPTIRRPWGPLQSPIYARPKSRGRSFESVGAPSRHVAEPQPDLRWLSLRLPFRA